jgi:C4-dicarboxylate-specific signal transduction histidine kinase
MTVLQTQAAIAGVRQGQKTLPSARTNKPALVVDHVDTSTVPVLDVHTLPFAAALLVQQPNSLGTFFNTGWRSLALVPVEGAPESITDFARSFSAMSGVEGFLSWMEQQTGDQFQQPPHTEFRAEFSNKSSNRWHEFRCYRVCADDASGSASEAAQWLLTLTDVTDRIERERAHREHETQLFYASKVMSVGEMAAVISHELNHPLASCINFLNGINRKLGAGSDEMRALQAPLQTAAAQAERAVQIVARIREFVRAREPKRSEVDITQLFEAVKRWIQRESAAAQVAIEISVSPRLPLLHVDRVMIEQVMVNLAKNAIEALCGLSSTGTAKSITLGAAPSVDDVGIAELWVTDSGDGLSAAAQSNLFSPFTSSKQQGMGIGLSICRSIVEFHRGRLWYEPNEGGGAKFILTLPITSTTD